MLRGGAPRRAHVLLGMIEAKAATSSWPEMLIEARRGEWRGSVGIESRGGDHFLLLTPEVDWMSPLDIVLVNPPM
jgi:hypothetical protein